MVSTPRRLPGAPSGKITAGPTWLIAILAVAAVRSSAAKSAVTIASPLASTCPDSDWPAGSTRPRAACAPSPSA